MANAWPLKNQGMANKWPLHGWPPHVPCMDGPRMAPARSAIGPRMVLDWPANSYRLVLEWPQLARD
eukprot:11163983-Lingulodinium_polyedra.AAC.1